MIGLHVYPIDESITDFDLNTDIEEYNYDGRVVFRGNMDPEYSTESVKVYWLYDDSNKRIGLVEHTADDAHTCLWYRDNVFSTLMQEDWSVYDESIWSVMSESAYNDCMRRGYTVNDLKTRTQSLRIVTPSDISCKVQEDSVTCMRCGSCSSTRSLYPGCITANANEKETVTLFDTLFVDDEGTIYIPPWDSKVYATLRRRGAAANALPAPPDTTGGGATSTTSAAGGSTTGYDEPSSSSSSSSAANAALALPAGGAAVVSPSS